MRYATFRGSSAARSTDHSTEPDARDPVAPRPPEHGVPCLQAGERRGLYAACVEAVVRPVAGKEQVVVAALVRSEAMRVAAGRALHVPVGRIDVGQAELGIDCVPAPVPVATAEQVPPERSS